MSADDDTPDPSPEVDFGYPTDHTIKMICAREAIGNMFGNAGADAEEIRAGLEELAEQIGQHLTTLD